MKNYLVTVTFDPKDEAAKVIEASFVIRIDNCQHELTAAALAGCHARRLWGDKKFGITSVKVNEEAASHPKLAIRAATDGYHDIEEFYREPDEPLK